MDKKGKLREVIGQINEEPPEERLPCTYPALAKCCID